MSDSMIYSTAILESNSPENVLKTTVNSVQLTNTPYGTVGSRKCQPLSSLC